MKRALILLPLCLALSACMHLGNDGPRQWASPLEELEARQLAKANSVNVDVAAAEPAAPVQVAQAALPAPEPVKAKRHWWPFGHKDKAAPTAVASTPAPEPVVVASAPPPVTEPAAAPAQMAVETAPSPTEPQPVPVVQAYAPPPVQSQPVMQAALPAAPPAAAGFEMVAVAPPPPSGSAQGFEMLPVATAAPPPESSQGIEMLPQTPADTAGNASTAKDANGFDLLPTAPKPQLKARYGAPIPGVPGGR